MVLLDHDFRALLDSRKDGVSVVGEFSLGNVERVHIMMIAVGNFYVCRSYFCFPVSMRLRISIRVCF